MQLTEDLPHVTKGPTTVRRGKAVLTIAQNVLQERLMHSEDQKAQPLAGNVKQEPTQ